MKKLYIILPLWILLGSSLQAQQVLESQSKTVYSIRQATVNISDIQNDFFPNLQIIEMPHPGMASESEEAELDAIKEKIKSRPYKAVKARGSSLLPPTKDISFNGNNFDTGVPNDNDMAISNAGKIISVTNSIIYMFDTTGTPLLSKPISLAAFSSNLNLPQGKYDPRALYDPETDRFIIVCLSGFNDSTSDIVIGFSQSNDPTGLWNVYAIPGNPLNDTTWTDYPIIALSKNEVLLTVNSLQNNKTWQEGFRQSYIWQINKADGYSGAAKLTTKVNSNIKYNGRPFRNLCPVQGGASLTGPETYFVSSRNFDSLNDTVFIIKLSNYMNNSPVLTMQSVKSTTKYGVPPNVKQPKNFQLQTNDARVLDAMIENNVIQFVGNTVNSHGKGGVFHGLIDISGAKPSLTMNIIEAPYIEYGYPAIAYAGRNKFENDAVILINYASDTTNPGNGAIFYKDGVYSDLQPLFKGNSYVFAITGKAQRWGDYSGAQRKYNMPGIVWTVGTYGKQTGSGINIAHVYGTAISRVHNPIKYATGIEPIANSKQGNGLTVYPSPVNFAEPIKIKFNVEEDAYLQYTIYDITGKKVADLMKQHTPAGENEFSFVTQPLAKGTYIFSISTGDAKQVFSTKFVVK